jgi:hypothetical protein
MSTFIFLGPTMSVVEAQRYVRATYLPPAEQGDILRILNQRPSAIGIVDGSFQFVPSVWHKEILTAMAEGVPVFGAASMGALRAAELAAFGMVGVGRIFELLHSGTLEDDDEVAVMHGPEEFGFRPLSEAMVNIRDICEAAVRHDVINAAAGAAIVAIAKRMYFPLRKWELIEAEAVAQGIAESELERFRSYRASFGPSLKQRDAIQMLQTIARLKKPTMRKAVPFRVEPTIFLTRLKREAQQDAAGAVDAPPGGSVDVARKKVLLGMLASKEAARVGLSSSAEEVDEMTSWFRETYGLDSDAELSAWLAQTGLGGDPFERAMRRFTAVVKMEEIARPELERETEEYLRLYGAASDHQQEQPKWLQINIALSRDRGNPQAAARILFGALIASLPKLKRVGHLASLHFVRKHPDIRLRLLATGASDDLATVLEALLTPLVGRKKSIESAQTSVYEPESRLFGGPQAMAAVHDYFHADTINWILLNDLFFQVLGCPSEVWDTWRNLYQLTQRSRGAALDFAAEALEIKRLKQQASADERAVLSRYQKANKQLAAALQALWDTGELSTGLRAILPSVAMFHCNRFGIEGRGQALLAKAMAAAWNPKNRLAGHSQA